MPKDPNSSPKKRKADPKKDTKAKKGKVAVKKAGKAKQEE